MGIRSLWKISQWKVRGFFPPNNFSQELMKKYKKYITHLFQRDPFNDFPISTTIYFFPFARIFNSVHELFSKFNMYRIAAKVSLIMLIKKRRALSHNFLIKRRITVSCIILMQMSQVIFFFLKEFLRIDIGKKPLIESQKKSFIPNVSLENYHMKENASTLGCCCWCSVEGFFFIAAV